MDKNTTDNLKEESTWLRLVFIVLYAILFNLAELVLTAVVIVQFLSTLIRGRPVSQITVFGQNLSTFVYEMLLFLTFKTDDMPWPITPWPSGPPSDDGGEEEGAVSEDSDVPEEKAESPKKAAPPKRKPGASKGTKTKPKPNPKT